MEAVAARRAAGLEAEELDGDDVGAEERREIADRTHEGNRRFAVGELIGHDLRNREMLHRIVERLLKGGREFGTRTDAFVNELLILAVIDALELFDRAVNAERRHLLPEGGRGRAVSGNADLDRHELLAEGFIRAHRTDIRDVDGQAARRAVGLGLASLFEEMGLVKALLNAFGKGFRELPQRLRRELFGLQFNEKIRHFLFVLHQPYQRASCFLSIGKPRRSRES